MPHLPRLLYSAAASVNSCLGPCSLLQSNLSYQSSAIVQRCKAVCQSCELSLILPDCRAENIAHGITSLYGMQRPRCAETPCLHYGRLQ